MATPVKETSVTIRGTEFKIRTDLDEAALSAMAAVVDGKMKELDPSGMLPPAKVSMLTSLTLAGELLDERQLGREDLGEVNARLGRLAAMLDETLDGD